MQDLADKIEKLEVILQKEIDAVLLFTTQENQVKTHLNAKNWPGLEQSLKEVGQQAMELETLETHRFELWEGVKNHYAPDASENFYQVVSHFPQEARVRLTDLRRQLKVAVVGLKGLTAGLESYVNITTGLIQGAIQEARPSLRGKMYCQKGQIRPTATASLVLDKQF